METVTLNMGLGRVRRVVEDGVEYFVAPLSLIVPGVLNGSQGSLFYPPDEIRKNVQDWEKTPIVVYHPMHNGQPVSAAYPGVLEQSQIGEVRNPDTDKEERLVAEGWFDTKRTQRVDPRVYTALSEGKSIELSTGLYTDNEPAIRNATCPKTGRSYTFTARNYRPDHLAILPDQVGACSIRDGCGVLVNTVADDGGWITLEGGQHVFIGKGKEFSPHGPPSVLKQAGSNRGASKEKRVSISPPTGTKDTQDASKSEGPKPADTTHPAGSKTDWYTRKIDGTPDAARPPITEQERDAVRVYTRSAYEELNNSLRKGDGALSERAAGIHQHLSTVFSRMQEFGTPTTVYRGMNIESKQGADQFVQSMTKAMRGGGQVQLGGYLSTTANEDLGGTGSDGFQGNVRISIKAVKGLDVSGISRYPDEKELLLPHNSKFHVEKVVNSGSEAHPVWSITLRQIGAKEHHPVKNLFIPLMNASKDGKKTGKKTILPDRLKRFTDTTPEDFKIVDEKKQGKESSISSPKNNGDSGFGWTSAPVALVTNAKHAVQNIDIKGWVTLDGGQHVFVGEKGTVHFSGPRGTRERAAASQIEKGQSPLRAGFEGHEDERSDKHTQALVTGGKWARQRGINLVEKVNQSLERGHTSQQFVERFRGAAPKDKAILQGFYRAYRERKGKSAPTRNEGGWAVLNAGHLQPRCPLSGQFKDFPFGAGSGPAHDAATIGHTMLSMESHTRGTDAAQQLAAQGHNPASWVEDEDIWEKAKAAADKGNYDKGSSQYWAVVSHIYEQMGGRVKKGEKMTGNQEWTPLNNEQHRPSRFGWKPTEHRIVRGVHLTDNAGGGKGFESDEQRAAFFGHLKDAGVYSPEKAGEDKGGKGSSGGNTSSSSGVLSKEDRMRTEAHLRVQASTVSASKKALAQTNKAEDSTGHQQAADLHKKAAQYHETMGNKEIAASHAKMAGHHEGKIAEHNAIKENIQQHLASNPKASISELRDKFGGGKKLDTHDPLSHPVHRALKELRDEGKVEAHETQFGEPRFSKKH